MSEVCVSLVLPAYNEAETIRQAIREADDALAAICSDYEVLVVDDGSRDRTAELAKEEAAQRSRVRVISHEKNLGYGAALRTGFAAAGKELIGTTDADCQYDPCELHGLMRLCRRHDVACGYRIDRQDSLVRRLLAGAYNRVAGFLFGLGVRDCNGSLKLFRRESLSRLTIETNGFFADAELLAKLRRQDASIAELGVVHRPRLAGSSKVSVLKALPVIGELLRFWWSWTLFPSRSGEDQVAATRGFLGGLSGGLPALLLLTALGSLLLLTGLSHPLMDPDETRYAQIPSEMLASGDFVVPTLDGEPYLDKPPLLYWVSAASFSIFGRSPYSARLPAALAALVTILVAYGLGRRLLGHGAAFLGALMLLLTAGLIGSAHFLTIDALLTTCTTTLLLSLFLAVGGERFRPGWFLVAGVAFGLGFLAKGPVILALGLPPIVASRWLSRSPVRLTARSWLLLAAPAVAIAAPWFVAISLRKPDFLEYFFWKHNVVRFTDPFNHQMPWWYYLPVMLVILLPVSLLIPSLVRFLFSRTAALRKLRSPELGFLVLASVWPVVFFSMSGSKMPSYILPMIPPLALALGVVLDAALESRSGHPSLRRVAEKLPWAVTLFGLVAIVVMALVHLYFDSSEATIGRYLVWSLVVGAVVLGLLASRVRLSLGRNWWPAAAVVWWATFSFVFVVLVPEIAVLRDLPARATRAAESLGDPMPALLSIGTETGPGMFYMRNDDIEDLSPDDGGRLRTYADLYPRLVIIMEPSHVAMVRSVLPECRVRKLGSGDNLYLVTK